MPGPPVLAHGVGGRQDLPISLTELVVGAVLALVVTFLALGTHWRRPLLDTADTAGRPVPVPLARLVDSAGGAWGVRLLGLALAGWFGVGLLAGPDTPQNPTAGAVHVLFWVGLVPLSLLFGPVWRALNPVRTLHLLAALALRRDPATGLRPLPPRLGYRPAAVGLLAFVWLELVAPGRATLPVIGGWLAAYLVAMLAGAVLYGAGWFDRGDAFEVLSALAGRLAIIGRRGDGALVWRNPLDGIASLAPAPGLVATVVVLLGSTMYDSVSNAPFWLRFQQGNGLPAPVTGTVGLVGVIGAVALAYAAATRAAARRGHTDRTGTPGELVHSVVPIAVAYLVAHYHSLLILEGQRTIALLSDPLDTGANLLGTANWPVRTDLVTPSGVANLQITVIVLGHLLGTLLAHDRALGLFPPAEATRAQVPLLVLMVGYTVTGLLLLFA
ncbi:hypothetical protein [Micromonospora sp. NBC_01796]|uniref:hypothetical protein n=1 Tax=Micromonospora sp. NBC_01796 TaxID=2975987 RepID=UPI002DD8FEEE|nr:hypothetical protein [Micromonospora sp. NBC_01796]WSA84531.1 hypothetical protein OIE47_29865 [Micromonospora sp. NBC_01796]